MIIVYDMFCKMGLECFNCKKTDNIELIPYGDLFSCLECLGLK